jgi:hypothetical protein
MKFKDLLKSKMADKSAKMSPEEQQAQLDVIQELKEMMDDHMGSKLKKVTVASDSPEGLQEGLEKAQELAGEMEAMPEDEESLAMDDSDEEMMDESEDMMADASELSEEDEEELKRLKA